MQSAFKWFDEFLYFSVAASESISQNLLAIDSQNAEFLKIRSSHLLPEIDVKIIYGLVDDLFQVVLGGLLGQHLKLINLFFSGIVD